MMKSDYFLARSSNSLEFTENTEEKIGFVFYRVAIKNKTGSFSLWTL